LKKLREVCKPLNLLVTNNKALFKAAFKIDINVAKVLHKFMTDSDDLIDLATKTEFMICLKLPDELDMDSSDPEMDPDYEAITFLIPKIIKIIEVCADKIYDLGIPENTPRSILEVILRHVTQLTRLHINVGERFDMFLNDSYKELFGDIIKKNEQLEQLYAKHMALKEDIQFNEMPKLTKIQIEYFEGASDDEEYEEDHEKRVEGLNSLLSAATHLKELGFNTMNLDGITIKSNLQRISLNCCSGSELSALLSASADTMTTLELHGNIDLETFIEKPLPNLKTVVYCRDYCDGTCNKQPYYEDRPLLREPNKLKTLFHNADAIPVGLRPDHLWYLQDHYPHLHPSGDDTDDDDEGDDEGWPCRGRHYIGSSDDSESEYEGDDEFAENEEEEVDDDGQDQEVVNDGTGQD